MIYSLISARGGSKGVPGKNIRLLGGYPLIAYTVAASVLTPEIKRTVVSTDSKEIAAIARKYGAEIPFMRPAEISGDNSTDLELLQHAISWFDENEAVSPELIVHLRPTTPFRSPLEMSRAIKEFQLNPKATSLRSVHELAEPPQKQVRFGKDGFLEGFFPDDPRPEYYNLPRQLFPKAYQPNGHIDIIKTECVKKTKSHFGPNTLGFRTSFAPEVDLPEDFDYLEYILDRFGSPLYNYLSARFSKEV